MSNHRKSKDPLYKRMSFRLTHDQDARLKVPWGSRGHVFSVFITKILDLAQKSNWSYVNAILIGGHYKIIPSGLELELEETLDAYQSVIPSVTGDESSGAEGKNRKRSPQENINPDERYDESEETP